MIHPDLTYPIEAHPTWNIHDSSKVQEFLTCPRKYFFRYTSGWAREGANPHLVYGEAVHKALAHLTLHGYKAETIIEAYQLFLTHYRKYFPPEMDEELAPKSPNYTMNALAEYTATWEDTDKKYKTLHVEVAGSVAISDRHKLEFRIDSILEGPYGIVCREHKTGSYLSQAWIDRWSTSFQLFCYNHVLFRKYGPDKVYGVEVNGFIARKSGFAFERIPIRKTPDINLAWLWEANYWLDQIQWNYDELAQVKSEDDVMTCFPKNPESCTKYNRPCQYLPFCTAWANPCRYMGQIQSGFKREYWNPADFRKDAGKVVDIKEIE